MVTKKSEVCPLMFRQMMRVANNETYICYEKSLPSSFNEITKKYFRVVYYLTLVMLYISVEPLWEVMNINKSRSFLGK
jgi:hypothetical protein